MICTNCFEADTETSTVTTHVDEGVAIEADCDKCPKCGDITFNHQQALALDEKRRELLRRSQEMQV